MDLSKKRFLVVDDFSEFRSSIRGILRLLGVQHIDTAANGQDVLELCRRNSYDIILHDYNLGEGVSGQQVLERLHAAAPTGWNLHDIQANMAARQLDLANEQQALEKAVALSRNNIRRQIRLAHQSWLF